jgi:hypothetical protein
VAGGAGAASAAGMFDVNAEIDRHIQQRFGFAMFVVRQFPVFELHRLSGVGKGHFRHTLL